MLLTSLAFDRRGHVGASQTSSSRREDAYRANNVGVALLEQFKFNEAAVQFRRALQIDPGLLIARINLCIALFYEPELESALREAKAAAAILPEAPQPQYLLGLIAKSQNRSEDAAAAFQRVLKIDPADVGANVNLGQMYLQQRKYADAVPLLRAALQAEPYNETATYVLGLVLSRNGQREEGQKIMERFQTLRKGGYGTKIDKDYLEQGKYAEAILSTGAEPDLVDTNTPDVTFVDSTATMMPASAKAQSDDVAAGRIPVFNRRYAAGELNEAAKRDLVTALGGCAVLFDYDGDGDLDLVEAGPSGQRLYRNDDGKFVDVSAQSGALARGQGAVTAIVAGDYDNDGKPDLLVVRYGSITLYHNDGGGRFSDSTAAAGIPAYAYLSISAAFVDVDHDGDLDIFIAGFVDLAKTSAADGKTIVFPADFAGAPNLLLRNDGNGKFTDITSQAKVTGSFARAVAVVATDYDNRRDIDLLVANFNAAPTLFRNMRDGTFVDVAPQAGLSSKGPFTSVAAGDINKDGYTDFYFASADGPGVLALSDGHGKFNVEPAPSDSNGAQLHQSAAQFVDYDNDGLLDIATISDGGLRIRRNAGARWIEVTDRSVSSKDLDGKAAPRVLTSGDIDGDGDIDFVLRTASGEIKILRNDGGSRNRSLRVVLAGKVSNRSGVGSKIEARSGSLKQKLETYSASPAPAPADTIFGLGKRSAVDAVRVIWPSGVVQAETEIPDVTAGSSGHRLLVTELDRKPSSCPFLYAWNGSRFEFITDFMGGGEMGYWEGPGTHNRPDPDEYVRIRDDQLKERDGRYEIRVTNELEETLYVDRLQLVAIAHPAGVEVYPNEGMSDPPRRFKLFVTKNARPPVAAVDDHGHDVLARISSLDRQYPDDFGLNSIRGYANQHSITLDLGKPSNQRTVLLLTGWTDYAFSSDNVGAHQAGLSMAPPALQVKDANGKWKTVIDDIGIPVGRPQTVTVDLTGKFLSNSREVRIITNMRIYWDQILVDTSNERTPVQVSRLDASSAELRWRGFSAEVTPDGREPFGYDYQRVSTTSPWKTMAGRFTCEGDVRELLLRSDDMFVISRPGDEIALSFDAGRLPALPKGWRRTFLLYADGFSKEMDINSASPDQVLPLPFHGMKDYPYASRSSYPMTAARRRYIELYNTRIVRSEVPGIDAVVASKEMTKGAAPNRR
ncbi:MAG TPA: FG-GAP-like repeat-containing protein [Blastocatellia bacterium]|nr:FG-GAP-like repeat-containing protein [Blastocatellia bacterium]